MIGVGGASVLFCEGRVGRGKGGGLETRNIKSWAGIDFFVISWDLSSWVGRLGLKRFWMFLSGGGALFDLLDTRWHLMLYRCIHRPQGCALGVCLFLSSTAPLVSGSLQFHCDSSDS